jgi:cell division protein FtsN
MDKRSTFFIYKRREMGILVFLAVLVTVFAFTLGVHLGKTVGPKGVGPAPSPAIAVGTVEDEVPNVQEFAENAAKVHQAADESLDQAAHDEAVRTGLKLDTPRQIELPAKPKSHEAGATTETEHKAQAEHAAPAEHGAAAEHAAPAEHGAPTEHAEAAPAHEGVAPAEHASTPSVPAAQRPSPEGKYTLQIGSHAKMEEAEAQANVLEAAGLKPILRSADVKGMKRFRLFVGGYPNHEAAQKAGKLYQKQQIIDSYVVANMP